MVGVLGSPTRRESGGIMISFSFLFSFFSFLFSEIGDEAKLEVLNRNKKTIKEDT